MSVLSSITAHLLRDGSLTPISQLILLVGNHVTVVLKKESQRETLELKHSSSLSGIEEIHYIDSKIFLEPFDIVVRPVKDLLDLRVCENLS